MWRQTSSIYHGCSAWELVRNSQQVLNSTSKMIIDCSLNLGLRPIWLLGLSCKYISFITTHHKIVANWIRGFPPDTIHVVFIEQGSVSSSGHFSTSRIMYRFLHMLGQTELDPSRINDTKNVDFFRSWKFLSMIQARDERKYVVRIENGLWEWLPNFLYERCITRTELII